MLKNMAKISLESQTVVITLSNRLLPWNLALQTVEWEEFVLPPVEIW